MTFRACALAAAFAAASAASPALAASSAPLVAYGVAGSGVEMLLRATVSEGPSASALGSDAMQTFAGLSRSAFPGGAPGHAGRPRVSGALPGHAPTVVPDRVVLPEGEYFGVPSPITAAGRSDHDASGFRPAAGRDPETAVMLLAGLGLIGFTARQRMKKGGATHFRARHLTGA